MGTRLPHTRRLAGQARIAAALGLGILSSVPAARASSLDVFLAEVEDAQRAASTVRGDFRARHSDRDSGERTFEGVVVHRGGDTYVEIREPRIRVFSRSGEGGQGAGGPPYQPLTGTPLILDDFRNFRTGALVMPQITAETPKTFLVSGAPAEPSPFVLIVYLLDRATLRQVRTQYYERTVNNLVRMRTDEALERVDGTWRPGRSEISTYATGASTTIEFTWKVDPTLPAALFDDPENGPAVSLLE
jgi:hypothetical protein